MCKPQYGNMSCFPTVTDSVKEMELAHAVGPGLTTYLLNFMHYLWKSHENRSSYFGLIDEIINKSDKEQPLCTLISLMYFQ